MSNPENFFSSVFPKGHLLVKESPLKIPTGSNELLIGIPKETLYQENRVPLVPSSVHNITLHGHKVIIESGAGENSFYTDTEYSEAGAEITESKKRVYDADIILKVSPPTLEELDLFHRGQILVSPLQFPVTTKEYIKKLVDKRVIAIAMEYMQAEDKSFPVVKIMSEITGTVAVLTAAEYLSEPKLGKRVLLGSISGVPPIKVVVLGAGMVGEHAVKTALSLGASVRVFDDDIYKIMQLKSRIGRHLHTSVLDPVYLQYQLLSADVLITAIHSNTGRVPMVITEDMVMKMKKGAVIVDVSIDQGGCVETSRITTHDDPIFVKHGVIHYCVPNIPSKVGRTASIAFSNILAPLILKTGMINSFEALLYNNPGLLNGVYTYKGNVTNEFLAKYFEMKYTSLDLLLSAGL
ncbi:MAG TPA: alanine dehydrogenase [Bacteroidetes bacterium]|nr:alanine dehydrogenase [Bacteroidota bacterium]